MKIQDMLQMQVIMFFLIALGAVLKKRGLITVQAKKFLSDLIIQIVLPCNIIYAFCSLKDPSGSGIWSGIVGWFCNRGGFGIFVCNPLPKASS